MTNEENNISTTPQGDTAPVVDNKAALRIGTRAFVLAFIILSILMTTAFVLTRVIPQGSYLTETIGEDTVYVTDSDGNPIFNFTDGEKLPFWKALLAPILLLNPSIEGTTIIYLIIFLLLAIGGVFNVLDKSGTLKYILTKIVRRFRDRKYALIAVVSLMFMVLGSTVGMFEETIPFVPIIVMLCYSLGFDSLLALGMTVMAAALGFSAGVINPFTTLIALELGGMTITDGLLIRLIVFALTYGLLLLCLLTYAKKITANPRASAVYEDDEAARERLTEQLTEVDVTNPLLDKATRWFAYNFIFLAVFVVASLFIKALSDVVIVAIVLVYVSCGIGSGVIVKTDGKTILKQFLNGALNVAPAIIMILMASSVKYIITEGGILDSILYYTVQLMYDTPVIVRPLLLYLVVFLLNFFISSGSAKANLLMPILYPISDLSGISRLITVTAFLFGDGFSNMLFPTNAVLLLSLSLTTVSYAKWFKWSIKLQLLLLVMSCATLMTLTLIL